MTRARIVELEAKESALAEKHDSLAKELETVKASHAADCARLETSASSAAESEAFAVAAKEMAEADSKRQTEIAAQNIENYQRQMLLHAADMEQLQTCKKSLEEVKKQVHELATAKETAEQR